ncbi:MAG: xanthine dehydrogenase family protein molybdopterin-binding subunit [Acidimicrobiales bacterium]
MGYKGQSIRGARNPILATGHGEYTGDIAPENALWAAFVRSDYAHAKILGIDTSEALGIEGVEYVVTGDEIAAHVGSIGMHYPDGVVRKRFRHHALATDIVHFSGQAVAMVVAESRYAAHEAAGLVDVEYEPLDVLVDAEYSLSADSPNIIDGWDDNVVFDTVFTAGDADAALETATHRLSGRTRVQRHLPVPMEPRSYVASYDQYRDHLTVWASTQMPHTARSNLANYLGMPSNSIRVIQPDVGGGFGTKGPSSIEQTVICFASKILGRPVRWVEERTEYFLACGHARETIVDFEVGCDADGRIDALKLDLLGDIGFPGGAWVQTFVTAYCLPGAYVVPNCTVDLKSVVTNKCFWMGYRGFGKEVASYAMDRILDRVADATGVDRAEVRMRNFIPKDAFPYSQVSGAMIDSGDYQAAMTRLLELVDVPAFREEQATAAAEGRHIGLGFGFELTPEGCSMPENILLQGWDGSTVRMDPLGQVTVLTGVTSPGSGNETGIAQIVADELGVPMDTIKVVQGDTDLCPYGLGNFSSRSLMMGGSAAYKAAGVIRDKLLNVASHMLEASADDLEMAEGIISVRGTPSISVPVAKVAYELHANAFGPNAEEVDPGLDVTEYFQIDNVYHQPEKEGRFSMYPTWPFMAAAAVVEVDPDTGFVDIQRFYGVHDCGTVINPLLVDAQVHGAVAQGVGAAVYEELVYDDAGQLLTAGLMDYTIPTAIEMPAEFVLEHQETPSPATPLGAKGAGESGVCGPMAAVASAVEDALPGTGAQFMELPITPVKVWTALHAAAD